MEHLLDNPAWSALNSGNLLLANGNSRAKYFDKEVSPFVAAPEYTDDCLTTLHQILPDNSRRLLVAQNEINIPEPWKVLGKLNGFQMVHQLKTINEPNVQDTIALTHEHIPQMLALTQLTNPGPFADKTIDFGHYCGIFDGDKLVAMAGQRFHAYNYTEVSAVCTHPNYLGKGYARKLLQLQIHRMKAEGKIPFLHVRHDNERAIKVYEDLGFSIRTGVCFHFIQKNA